MTLKRIRQLTIAAAAFTPLLGNPQEVSGQSATSARIVRALPSEKDEPGQGLGSVRHTRSRDFILPFSLTESEKQSVKEVQLFVRTPDSPWQKRDVAGPSEGRFQFKVLEEGEIWFGVVTCDQGDHTNPADPRNMAPALRVIVDCTPPTFQMGQEPGKPPVGQPLLRLTPKDQNLDPKSLSVACMTGGNWYSLTPVQGETDLFPLPPNGTGVWKIRAICRDLAGNQGNFEGQFPPAENGLAKKAAPSVGDPKAPATTEKPSPTPAAKQPEASQIAAGKDAPAPVSPPAKTPEAPKPPEQVKVLVNSTRAQLDYAIEEIGPSGVGKVEIWCTQDQGKTWKKLAEDPDAKSPAECDFPGQGEFGISFVITNGSGAGARVPSPGDKPETILEVDTTHPTGKLAYAQVLATESGAGPALFIKWEAKDKNLGDKPIHFCMAPSPEGPFSPICEPVANTGEFKWPMPANCPPRLYLRMEVVDGAGNLTAIDHPAPILTDPSKPKGKILAVRPGSNAKPLAPANPNLVPTSLVFPAKEGQKAAGENSPIPLAAPTPAPASQVDEAGLPKIPKPASLPIQSDAP